MANGTAKGMVSLRCAIASYVVLTEFYIKYVFFIDVINQLCVLHEVNRRTTYTRLYAGHISPRRRIYVQRA